VTQQQAETSQPAARTPAVADERLVLAFGDSLYAGYGLDQDQSFPAVLERQLEGQGVPARVVNAGVSGDTTAAGLARLSFTLEGLPRKPDLAIVGLGANDALRGVDPSETRRNLDAIMSELARRGIPVVITGMMAPRNLGRDYSSRFDAIYPDLAKRYDARLDPFFLDGVITTPDLLLKDGIHPNAAGIEIMVKRVGPLVAQELRRS
jgi:acyl-CoA thioesterase-1